MGGAGPGRPGVLAPDAAGLPSDAAGAAGRYMAPLEPPLAVDVPAASAASPGQRALRGGAERGL
jgi:hypothetical protein